MLSEKCIFRANDLSFEVCSEGWVIFGQPFRNETLAMNHYKTQIDNTAYLECEDIHKGTIPSCQHA